MGGPHVAFEGSGGRRLAGRLDLPAGEPRAWALFAHCFTCGKDGLAASRVGAALATHGIATLRFDFAGLGDSEGEFGESGFSSNLDDLVAAANHLRERFHPPALLVGHSLGGAAVLAAAARIPEARAVATIGAPNEPGHVVRLFGAATGDIRDRGEATVRIAGRTFTIRRAFLDDLARHPPGAAAAALNRPLLVLHAPGDQVVSLDHALALFAAAVQPKAFVPLSSADHLLTRRDDAHYAAALIAAWSAPYLADGGKLAGIE